MKPPLTPTGGWSKNPEQDNFLLWLGDRLRENGYKIEIKTPYHFRINDALDIYPQNRRYHDLIGGLRGDYDDIFKLVKWYFPNKTGERNININDKDGLQTVLTELPDISVEVPLYRKKPTLKCYWKIMSDNQIFAEGVTEATEEGHGFIVGGFFAPLSI